MDSDDENSSNTKDNWLMNDSDRIELRNNLYIFNCPRLLALPGKPAD